MTATSTNLNVQISGLTLTGGSADKRRRHSFVRESDAEQLDDYGKLRQPATAAESGQKPTPAARRASRTAPFPETPPAVTAVESIPYNRGTTSIQNSTISGNTADGDAGGVWAKTYAGGTTTIQNSTISGNTASGNGGGIRAYNSYLNDGTRSVTAKRPSKAAPFPGNTASGDGGGMWAENYDGGSMTIQSSTISQNVIGTVNATGGSGGGIWAENYAGGYDDHPERAPFPETSPQVTGRETPPPSRAAESGRKTTTAVRWPSRTVPFRETLPAPGTPPAAAAAESGRKATTAAR